MKKVNVIMIQTPEEFVDFITNPNQSKFEDLSEIELDKIALVVDNDGEYITIQGDIEINGVRLQLEEGFNALSILQAFCRRFDLKCIIT